ncbi:hypothetical protein FRX31_023190 [Thalictrum thalictroides]|uniref:Uncharacterized protein n=1 Tax=Thalictrum thalictroides TaxID=46969 RepID=A0A7J6VQ65_THATH|nr:hypothetical protein FRX31_023190 [Thalictrum thalictroides]
MEIAEDLLGLRSPIVEVKVFKPEWGQIPRFAVLEERGFVHNVLIEMDASLILNILADQEITQSKEVDNWSSYAGKGDGKSNGRKEVCCDDNWHTGAGNTVVTKPGKKQMAHPKWLTWRPLQKQPNQTLQAQAYDRDNQQVTNAIHVCSENSDCPLPPLHIGNSPQAVLTRQGLKTLPSPALINDEATSEIPPGFEQNFEEGEHSQVAETQPEFATQDGSLIRTEEDLRNWIIKLAKPAALQLGLSSNLGVNFIDKTLMEVGARNLKEKNIDTLNEDERERMSYENTNDVLGKIKVPNDV